MRVETAEKVFNVRDKKSRSEQWQMHFTLKG